MTHYDSLWLTMTQNILTISHCDPLRAPMTKHLISRFVMTQKRSMTFYFLKCTTQKPFLVKKLKVLYFE